VYDALTQNELPAISRAGRAMVYHSPFL